MRKLADIWFTSFQSLSTIGIIIGEDETTDERKGYKGIKTMPQKVTQRFEFTGWATVTIYTEKEMAEILKMSQKQLWDLIQKGTFTYSAHPMATHNKEYEFSKACYLENIARWACLQAGGHHFVFDKYLDDMQRKARYKCSTCPAVKYD